MKPGPWAQGQHLHHVTALAWPHATAVPFPATSHAGLGDGSSPLPAPSPPYTHVFSKVRFLSPSFRLEPLCEQCECFCFILFHFKAYILIAISATILKPEIFHLLCTEMIGVFKRGSQNWVSKHTISGGEAVGSKCLQGQPKCLLFSDVFTGRGLPFVSEVCWPELLRDCVLVMFTGTQGRMCYYIHVVCLALGFQNHLELSGHFLRASESSLYIRCQEPWEDRAVSCDAGAQTPQNWG